MKKRLQKAKIKLKTKSKRQKSLPGMVSLAGMISMGDDELKRRHRLVLEGKPWDSKL